MEVKKLTGGPRYCRTCRGALGTRLASLLGLIVAFQQPTNHLERITVANARPACSRWTTTVGPSSLAKAEVASLTPPPFAGPWVNNCVGHANYGHFIRFLFMVDVACSYHLWMITKRAFGTLAFAVSPLRSFSP